MEASGESENNRSQVFGHCALPARMSAWISFYSRNRRRFIDELPNVVLGPLKIAFDLHGAASVEDFFDRMDNRAGFTGIKPQENVAKLVNVLGACLPHSQLVASIDRAAKEGILGYMSPFDCISFGSGDLIVPGSFARAIQLEEERKAIAASMLPPAAAANRLGDPVATLAKEDTHMIVKVSRVGVSAQTTVGEMDYEICGTFKTWAAAAQEANLRLDEEINAAGGDEHRVRNAYTIWSFVGSGSPAPREVKNRVIKK